MRVARDQILAVVEGSAASPHGLLPAALLTLADGSSRSIAFGDPETAMSTERAGGERTRAGQFVKLVRSLNP